MRAKGDGPVFAVLIGLLGVVSLALFGPVATVAIICGLATVMLYRQMLQSRPALALALLVLIPTFESLAVMLTSTIFHLSGGLINALLTIKFLLLGSAAGSAVLVARGDRGNAVDASAFVLVFYSAAIFAAFFFANEETYRVLPQVRGLVAFLTPVLLYGAARFTPLSSVAFVKLVKYVMLAAVGAAAFGLFERLALPLSFWTHLHLPDFVATKGALQYLADRGVADILGSSFSRRLIGPFDYPLNAGYFFILPFLLLATALFTGSLTRLQRLVFAAFIVVGLAELLTFTRGAWAGIFVSIVILGFVSGKAAKWLPIIIGALILFTVSPFGQSVIIPTLTLSDPSIRQHLLVLEFDVQRAFGSLVGNGFGTAGFAANSANGHAAVGENLLATISEQCGLIGIAIFLFFVMNLTLFSLASVKGKLARTMRTGLLMATLAYFIGSFTTEHWLAFESASIYWLLAGAYVGLRQRFDDEIATERISRQSLAPAGSNQ